MGKSRLPPTRCNPYTDIKAKRRKTNRHLVAVGILVAVAVAVSFRFRNRSPDVTHQSNVESSLDSTEKVETKDFDQNEEMQTRTEIQLATTSTNVSYYHCSQDDFPKYHLVLMHGARFSKQDWKEKGILQTWCDNPQVSVTALDQPPTAFGAVWFHETIDALEEDKKLDTPVVLVSPSKSGLVISDWIMGGASVSLIDKYIRMWIPIAPGSMASASDSQMAQLGKALNHRILAIYGDQDAMGAKVSKRMKENAGATLVELPGGHPVYLDVPEQFVQVVNEYLGI